MPKRNDAFDDTFDEENGLDLEEQPGFERIRRNTGKAPTAKSDRQQYQKEWGRKISKFHKERKRTFGDEKP